MIEIPQNVPLGILIVAVSSLLFATGTTIQHLAVGKISDGEGENPSMNLKELLRLIRTPLWLTGLLILAVGGSGHIVGLALAPVTVVQPVGVLAVPASVILAVKIHGHKIPRQLWTAIAMTVLGIAIFTWASARRAAPDTTIESWQVLAGCVVLYLAALGFGALGLKGPVRTRHLMFASAGAFFYGLASALVKTVAELVQTPDFLSRPLFWIMIPFLVGCYILGGTAIQQGHANGPPEIVVASMTTTDPVIAVAFGIIVLGEGALITPGYALVMAIGAALAIYGVIVLSKYHPEAVVRRERAELARQRRLAGQA